MGRTGVAAILCCGVAALYSNAAVAQTRAERNAMLESKSKEFAACKTPRDRLAFVIAAIDDGTIDVGAAIEDIRVLFSRDFVDIGAVGTDGVKWAGYVNFERVSPQPSNPAGLLPAPKVEGWYLYLTYDRTGRVSDYWLSNVHKGMAQHSK